MTDERIVEAMAARIRLTDKSMDSREFADLILAALEAAGYAIYRPDDCEGVTVEVMNVARGTGPIDGFFDAGTYRLVPVGGDS